MSPFERRRAIVEILCRERQTTTEKLASALGVTMRTIRNDISRQFSSVGVHGRRFSTLYSIHLESADPSSSPKPQFSCGGAVTLLCFTLLSFTLLCGFSGELLGFPGEKTGLFPPSTLKKASFARILAGTSFLSSKFKSQYSEKIDMSLRFSHPRR